jgi:hypothetical protein
LNRKRKPKAAEKKKPKSTHGGKRPGAGRPPRYTLSQKEILDKAKHKARAAMETVVDGWIEDLKAMEPVFWQGQLVTTLAHATARAEARRQLADRGGLPKLTQVETVTASAALGALVEDLAAGLRDVDDDPES